MVDAPMVLDRRRLMVRAALGDPSQNDVRMTAKLRRYEASIKSNNDLPKPLMIEWE